MATYTPAYYEGYNFCYDGFALEQCSYSQASDEFGEFAEGYADAEKEMREERDAAEVDAEEYASIYD